MTLYRTKSLRYGIAIGSVAVATLLRLSLNHLLSNQLLFALAFCAVIASSWFGGRGPGLLSVCLAGLATWILIVPPQLRLSGKPDTAVFPTVAFCIVSTLIAIFCGSLSQTMAALEDREARLKFMTAAMPEILFTADSSGNIESLSDRFQEYSGRSLEEIGPSGWMTLVEPDALHPVTAAWKAAVESKGEFRTTCRLKNKDGQYRWFQCRAVPMHDKRQAVVRWFGVCADIEDQKRLEGALAENSKALERSNEDLQRFAFATSHDLQEPLRMIQILADLLGRNQSDTEETNYLIGQIKQGAHRMQDLIKTSLEFSQIGPGNAQIQSAVSLEEPLADAIWGLQAAVEQSGATIEHEPLPEVMGDSKMISRVFQNLIANALKFRGEEPPVVKVSANKDGSMCVIAISDNGIGMPMDYAETIFEAFRRLHSKDRYPGSGLGLASVKRIVEIHQGRVWVKSSPGEGSTFFFTLPAAKSDDGRRPLV